MVALGRGVVLMSEVPLYMAPTPDNAMHAPRRIYRGTSLIRNGSDNKKAF